MAGILDYADAIQILKVVEVEDEGKVNDTQGEGLNKDGNC